MAYMNLSDEGVRQDHAGDGLLRMLFLSLGGGAVAMIAALCLYNV